MYIGQPLIHTELLFGLVHFYPSLWLLSALVQNNTHKHTFLLKGVQTLYKRTGPKTDAHTLSYSHTNPSQITSFFFFPTIFAVEVDLHFPLLRPKQGLRHLGDGQSLGVWSVQEVTRAWLLHDFSARVTTQVAEAIVAEDDGAVLHSCIGYDELTTCRWNEKRFV